MNSETEFAKASKGPADEFIVRETNLVNTAGCLVSARHWQVTLHPDQLCFDG